MISSVYHNINEILAAARAGDQYPPSLGSLAVPFSASLSGVKDFPIAGTRLHWSLSRTDWRQFWASP
jgi:hypothetical protein